MRGTAVSLATIPRLPEAALMVEELRVEAGRQCSAGSAGGVSLLQVVATTRQAAGLIAACRCCCWLRSNGDGQA